jgi:methionyl-tRNA formyltransferase
MNPRRLRLAFMGTPDFAVPVLDALVAAGHEVAAVYSQPPRPTGRGHKTQPSPVQARAEALGLEVRHPLSLKPDTEKQAFADLGLDAAVVAAYGLILPKAILEAPRLGCLNVHASLLPRWRGAAPIQRALMAGDAETGVTIMQMDVGLDTGDMLLKGTVPITAETTGSGLHDSLSDLGARLIVPALDAVAQGAIRPEKQPEDGVTYAAKLVREEGALDFREDAAILERKVRALNPWPGTWFEHEGERIKLLAVQVEPGSGEPGQVVDDDLGIATGTGVLRPTLLQRAGRGPVERRAFLNGTRVSAGTRLSCLATN